MPGTARWLALVAALVAVAGCSGPGVPGPATPTGTPAPVPTDTPSRYPPGVLASGVYDPGALVAAHRDRLSNVSHAVRETRTERYLNGTVRARRVETARVLPGGRFHRVVRLEGRAASHPLFPRATRVELYAGGERGPVYAAGWRGTDARYATVAPANQRTSPLRLLLQAFETRAEVVEPNGTRLVAVEGTAVADRYFLESAEGVVRGAVRNATFHAVVEPGGLVREYRVRYALAVDGTLVRVTNRVAYTDLGTATVSRPDWYDEAVARTGER
jgi:hypothetical protein